MGNLRSKDVDPDTAWKAQNREQQDNQLYRFINLKRGGELVRVYEKEGPAAFENFVRREIDPLLYHGGQGEKISRSEWIRFQAKCAARLKMWDGFRVAVEPKGSVLDEIDHKDDAEVEIDYGGQEMSFTPFADHEACWRLDCRGSMGETALHLLCLHNSPLHTEIAKLLLKLYPKMALDMYEGDEYYGETALHLAIVYGDQDLVKLLVENGADVNQRATGRFFLPEDQKKKKVKVTNYEGYAYYGEYPLAFAACFGHEEIYDYLVERGADPNAKDSFGNTVLHMLVINNKINMFSYAVKHHAKRALMEIENAATLTPLTLASKLGRHGIFKEIIELQSFEVWRYSNIMCSCYPLAPLDTIGIGGRANWSSALIYITDGKTDEHLEMLEGGVIKQLLDEKWKTYAQRKFFERFATTCLYIVLLSCAIYLRPPENLLGPVDAQNIVRYVLEIIVVLYVFFNVCLQIEEMRLQGVATFFKNQFQAPAKAIFNISCILILACVPLRFLKLEGEEGILLTFAAPMSWFFLLFFLRGSGTFGPFVIMIYQMTASDIIRFFVIFSIFLIQFSQGNQLMGPFVIVFYRMIKFDLRQFVIIYVIFLCGCFTPSFYYLFRDTGDSVSSFKNPYETIFQLFQMTLGEFKYDDIGQTRQPDLTKIVFMIFAMLVPILLLNMLIAMMGNTYQQVISRSEKEWKRQWAKIIIVLERSYSRAKLLKFQEEYSVPLIGSESAGLMVIKTCKKTKARQRKGAIANWKRMVKDVKSLLKEAKRTGKTVNLHSKDVLESVPLITPRAPVQALDEDMDESMSADGLISAMTQLAWEKDIDLTRAPAFKDEPIVEEPQKEMSEAQKASAKGKRTPPGGNTNNNSNEQRPSSGNGSGKPRLRSGKVAPSDSVSQADIREGSGARSARSRAKGKKSRPSSAEKDGDDPKVFTISGNGGESTSSLSSLLNNAWETKTEDTNV